MCLCSVSLCSLVVFLFFFFNDTATTEIYTLSLHDALPISRAAMPGWSSSRAPRPTIRSSTALENLKTAMTDRKSTRLNSSHGYISYAVFCLKKKKKKHTQQSQHPHQNSASSHRVSTDLISQ